MKVVKRTKLRKTRDLPAAELQLLETGESAYAVGIEVSGRGTINLKPAENYKDAVSDYIRRGGSR